MLGLIFFQGIENVQKELEAQYTQQMADMEHKVNDARREHTKAGRRIHANFHSIVYHEPRRALCDCL